MEGYWDSFDCEIQCEELYDEEFDFTDEDYALTPEEEAFFSNPL